MRRSDQYLYSKDKTNGKRRMALSSYLLLFIVGFGVLLIFLNVYQLFHLSKKTYGDSPFQSLSSSTKRCVWIYAKKVCFHIISFSLSLILWRGRKI